MTTAEHLESGLATKVVVPRQPRGAVSRARLLTWLDESTAGPLTLLVAGAGTGKTVLLSEWAASGRAPGPVAWAALDATDANPRRFWSLVLRALEVAGVGEPVASLKVPASASVDAIVPALGDALAERDPPMVLVLDDFHEVAGAVAPALDRLLRHPPGGLRLVLASRVDPPLRLGRLRVAGGLAELHAGELACTVGEAGTVLESFGAQVTDEHVRRLWARTEGWPAALALAASSLGLHPDGGRFIEEFTGDSAAVSDYLVSEVLARQPVEVRNFLLRTSVADTLDGELACCLSGRDEGHRMLEELAGLGVPIVTIDDRARWYRYHALFAEFLRAQLRLELPGEVSGLHARAAEFFAQRGDEVEAFRHAIGGRAWPLAARLAAERGPGMLLGGRIEAVAPLMGSLSHEEQRQHPQLALMFAALQLERGDRAAAEAALTEALVAHANGDGDTSGAEDRPFALMLTLVRHRLARIERDVSRRSSLAEDLLEHSNRDELAPAELRSFALADVGMGAFWKGDFDTATQVLERALLAARQAESDWPAMVASANLALVAASTGDLVVAERRAGEAIAIARRRGWTDTWPASLALELRAYRATQRLDLDEAERLLARVERALDGTRHAELHVLAGGIRSLVLEARGRYDEALALLHSTGYRRQGLAEMFVRRLQQVEARFLISLGRIESARAALERVRANGSPDPDVCAELARLQLLRGDPSAAHATLAPALEGDHHDRPERTARAWIVEALACEAQHDTAGADESLARAIGVLADAGMVHSLVIYGPALAVLLERQLRQGTGPAELVERALAALEPEAADADAAAQPLTDRESQVLAYLPTMLSTPEIASELFVSTNTVRSHMKAIYLKLGVHQRTQAVSRARQLQLID